MNRQTNFKAGDRVRLVSMTDDPDPIPAGTTGTVAGVYPHSDWTQVDVDWDNGRSLMLSIPPDRVEAHRCRHPTTEPRKLNHVHTSHNRTAAARRYGPRAPYLHFDGYPDHVLPILRRRLPRSRRSARLIEGGELRSLSPRPANAGVLREQPANRGAAQPNRSYHDWLEYLNAEHHLLL